MSNNVLQNMGLWWNSGVHLFQCRRCRVAFSQANAPGHILSNHNVRQSDYALDEWVEFCHSLPVNSLPLVPTPLGPPVEQLDVHNGLACRLDTDGGSPCQYAVVDLHTMKRHVSKVHHISCNTPYVPAIIQTLSSNTSKIYFEVVPSLASLEHDDPMTAVHAHLGPFLPKPTIFQPTRSNQRPLLLERTNWDGLLVNVRGSPEHRAEVERLFKPASRAESDDMFVRLGLVVTLAFAASDTSSKLDPHGLLASYILKVGQEGYNIQML